MNMNFEKRCFFTLHYLIFLVWRWNRYIIIKLEIWHAYNIPGWSWSWRGRDVGIFLGASGLGWRGGEGLLPLGYTVLGIVVENGQTRLKGNEIQWQIYQNQCVISFYYLNMKKKNPQFFLSFFFFLFAKKERFRNFLSLFTKNDEELIFSRERRLHIDEKFWDVKQY